MDNRTVGTSRGNRFLFQKFDPRKTFKRGKIGEALLIDGAKTFPGIFVAVLFIITEIIDQWKLWVKKNFFLR